MTTFQAAVLTLASLLPQEAPPQIDGMPRRVCVDAPRAIFQVENKAAMPVLVALSVERWSDEGDSAGWTIVQQDITRREALSKEVRNLTIEPLRRRDFAWDLKKRIGPPGLVTGRHRLVVTYSYKSGDAPGAVTHEFIIMDCSG
jgi:hypothetical protein